MSKNNIVIIGICGASGGGKTTLAHQLKSLLCEKTVIISQDCYYRDFGSESLGNKKTINFDHPNSIEFELIREHVHRLKAGRYVNRPNYCYTSHSRMPTTTIVKPCAIVIVEGSLIFTDENLRDGLDIKIFLDIDLDLCLSRRIERDMVQRGRSLESIMQQYEESVRPMAQLFMPAQKQHADLVLKGGECVESVINRLKQGARLVEHN